MKAEPTKEKNLKHFDCFFEGNQKPKAQKERPFFLLLGGALFVCQLK
jgi:hypothetical protein